LGDIALIEFKERKEKLHVVAPLKTFSPPLERKRVPPERIEKTTSS
jgi:hypothetical protein